MLLGRPCDRRRIMRSTVQVVRQAITHQRHMPAVSGEPAQLPECCFADVVNRRHDQPSATVGNTRLEHRFTDKRHTAAECNKRLVRLEQRQHMITALRRRRRRVQDVDG